MDGGALGAMGMAMIRIHHLDCGCMCPFGGALFDGFSKGPRAHLCCHCLLLETERDGLVLVDTGFGEGDVGDPSRLSRIFRLLNNIQFDPARTAVAQLRKLGFQAADVRHILLTHLDFDHAGGLSDFPNATVHLMHDEHAAVQQLRGFLPRRRFVPVQWRGISRWQLYREEGDQWYGFESVRSVIDDVLLIPLRGHTAGHAGIAVRGEDGWVLHAGDAYFFRHEIGQASRRCPPGLRLYQRLMDTDHDRRVLNQHRLRALSLEQPQLDIFCSHDARELARYP